jgi:pimeloyl-ACP methyl ester carboxylesterase
MKWCFPVLCVMVLNANLKAQSSFEEKFAALQQIKIGSGVTLTFDEPSTINKSKNTKIIIYALPNGNTTAQTFGKKLLPGDDWHFDIQHIGAQTAFIRHVDHHTNYIVVYVENTLKSWPAWRSRMSDSDARIASIVALILEKYKDHHPTLTLSGHSGGGSFIFGYLNSHPLIPLVIDRIGFLDATYGYNTDQHAAKLVEWLKTAKNTLQIIAYNDSVVSYNGGPLVSATGGTWYRSRLMARDLQNSYSLTQTETTGQYTYADCCKRIQIKLIKNPEAKIFHTVLVDRNGFIDLVLSKTKFEAKTYAFWGDRAYQSYILE